MKSVGAERFKILFGRLIELALINLIKGFRAEPAEEWKIFKLFSACFGAPRSALNNPMSEMLILPNLPFGQEELQACVEVTKHMKPCRTR